ncbi:MAG: 4-hydroxythreonine-4-phosphate dehydrogenase PdxA [Rudaea sp.]
MSAVKPWLPRLAVTLGEPAGIGPEIVAALAATDIKADLIAIGDRNLLQRAAHSRGILLRIEEDDGQWIADRAAGSLRCIHLPISVPETFGKLDVRNAPYVLATLARAADGCLEGEFDAMVTAPVQKSIINDAGVSFIGHTEFLASRSKCRVVMMLVAPGLRVVLATTHLPLADVPQAITPEGLIQTLRILYNDLRHRFGMESPRIAVLGLNPHAGESGHLGHEEIEIITPALDALRAEGLMIQGPLPADTAFLLSKRENVDAYLAMYHDQGLPVLKALGFGDSVNVTLGLPFIRTSVDHGTALTLAGTGTADTASMIAATEMAMRMVAASM